MSSAPHIPEEPYTLAQNAFLYCCRVRTISMARVAQVETVSLKANPSIRILGSNRPRFFFQHQLNLLIGHLFPHAVIHAAACKDNFGVVSILSGTLC